MSETILKCDRKRANFRVSKSYKALCLPMELRVKNWINGLRNEGACVSGEAIMKQAVLIYKGIHPIEEQTVEQQEIFSKARENFTGSRGWFQNFMKRHKFSYRRVSTTGRDLPNNTVELCYEFYKEVIF